MNIDSLKWTEYCNKDCVEKLFVSMTEDSAFAPSESGQKMTLMRLLIGFLAKSLISSIRILAKPVSGKATKFISDAM